MSQEHIALTRIRVRQAGLADAEGIAPLFDAYRQFYLQAPDLPLALSFVRERLSLLESAIFVALDEGTRIIGFTQLYPSFSSVSACRIWILNDLFVLPEARGRGAAQALLEAARMHALGSDAQRLDLSTAHDNPAQKLYESCGYRRDEGFFHYSLSVR